MHKLIKRTSPYIAAFILGQAVLPAATNAAYTQRGYYAHGGELLIPLLFVLIVALAKTIRSTGKEVREQ